MVTLISSTCAISRPKLLDSLPLRTPDLQIQAHLRLQLPPTPEASLKAGKPQYLASGLVPGNLSLASSAIPCLWL